MPCFTSSMFHGQWMQTTDWRCSQINMQQHDAWRPRWRFSGTLSSGPLISEGHVWSSWRVLTGT
jgi:hypothetical protein